MLLLEKLTVREFGSLHRVELDFQPQGLHLVTLAPDEAQALRTALATCVYGAPENLRARYDGARIECTLVVGGQPLTVRRTLRATSRDEAEVISRRGGRTHEIRGDAQVREAVEVALGLEQATFELLVDPKPRADLPEPTQVRELMRRLLGERRIREMESEFAERPDLQEEETTARARVEFAQTVARAADNETEMAQLERLLQRWRVRQALGRLEATMGRAIEAGEAMQAHRLSRKRMSAVGERWRTRHDLASLWAERAQRVSEVTRAEADVGRLETSLADMAPLAQRARAGAERLATLDRICDAFAASEEAAAAADRARSQRDGRRQATRELLRARSDLAEAEALRAQLRAGAERAKTLQSRSHEDDNLPAAHRLWGQLAEILLAEEPHEKDRRNSEALAMEASQTMQRLRSIELDAKRRRTRVLMSGAAVLLGLGLAVVGFVGAAPVAWLGIVAGIVGAIVGLWSLWSEHADQATETSLRDRLFVLEGERWANGQLDSRAMENGERRAQIEDGLRQQGLEVPETPERARILRDSATTRLRRLADGDTVASGGSTTAENERAADEQLAQAECEVQRLGARASALESSGPEGLAAAADTELRHQIEASGRARSRASELALSLDLPDDRRAVVASRDAQRRELAALEARLERSADLEDSHRRSQQRFRSAWEALPSIEQQIDSLTRSDPDLPRAEPTMTAAGRLVALAAFAKVVAAIGEARAAAEERRAIGAERTSHGTVTSASTELAGAVRAAGAQIDAAPTAEEVRAIFPDLDEEWLDDAAGARKKLQQARKTRRDLDEQIRQLELRTGVVRDQVDLEGSRAALDQLVDQRRVRTAASRMMTEALDALAAGVPAATEAALRPIVGRVTGGLHWDVRIAPDMTVHVWDDERDVWIPLLDLAAAQREPVKLAVGAAFVAAMRPHDAPQAPAFMWLDASHANSEISAIEALLDAIARTDLQERFPQIIVTAPARRLTRTSFDRVVPVVEGVSEAPVASPAAARRLKAVGS